MRYILGIDQGGSKTLAVVADEYGNILSLGRGPGACHSITGMDSAKEALRIACSDALRQAGMKISDMFCILGGLTGADWPHETPLLIDAICQVTGADSEKVSVVNDCLIALRAGTSSPSGCILCAGSGLNCAVRNLEGEQFVFGFYIKDDDQGGMALGRMALQAVFDAEIGLREETMLREEILTYMDCSDVDEMLMRHVIDGLPSQKILYLPRVLEKCALAGDQVSKDVLSEFGARMGRYVASGLMRMGMDRKESEVILSGSIFKCRAQELKNAVEDIILQAAPKAQIKQSRYEPIIGAALMALDKLNETDHSVIAENMERSAVKYDLFRQ